MNSTHPTHAVTMSVPWHDTLGYYQRSQTITAPIVTDTGGCELVSTSMVFNYFSRPEVVNKKLFGQFIKIHRVETKSVSSSSSEQTPPVLAQ